MMLVEQDVVVEPQDKFLEVFEVQKGVFLTCTVYYVTRPEQIGHVVAWLRQLRAVGVDTETGGLFYWKDKVATLQLGNPDGPDPRAYVIDVRCFTPKQLEPIFEFLRNAKLMKVGMNIGFEYRFLRHHYGVAMKKLRDIQLTELILRAGLFPEKKGKGSEDGGRHLCYGQTSLYKLCLRYLGVKIEKDDELRTSFYRTPPGRHNRDQIRYAASDTIYPFYVARLQKQEREARRLGGILDIEYELIPILEEATMYGIGIDQGAWRALWQEAIAKRAEAEAKLDKLFRDLSGQGELLPTEQHNFRPIYPGSKGGKGKNGKRKSMELSYSAAVQVRWALREYCKSIGWPVEIVTTLKRLRELKKHFGSSWLAKKREKNPAVSVDDIPEWLIPEEQFCILMSSEVPVLRLAMIRKQLPAEPVLALCEYSKYSKYASTYGLEFLNKHVRPETGRIHAIFHQAVTSTGRLSTEPNLQNIPRDKRYRACFKPKPGYKYVIADYSQIEPRLSAEVSKDDVYVKTFLDDDDIYCRSALAMTGQYPDKKTEDGAIMRQVFKVIVLALAYRMGAWKLRNQLTLALEKEILAGKVPLPTYEYTKGLLDRFLEVHTGVAAYQQVCSALADPKSDRKIWDRYRKQPVTWIEAPCGRKRFFHPESYDTYTAGPNAPIQGCSATITKAAAVLVQRVIEAKGYDAHIVDLIHDEIVWEVREDQAAEFAEIAKERMEYAGKFWIKSVPVKAEFPKGTNGVVDWWLKEAA